MSESVDLSDELRGNWPLPPPGALLPHAPPWLLVDRLVSVAAGEVVADKLVTANDALHSDGFAETLVIEALAQTAACLNALMSKKDASGAPHMGLLVQAKDFVFEGRAAVGDRITLRCRQTASFGALCRFSTEAAVGERVIARGELTFAIGNPP